ncbi:hypothetical protein C5B42_05185 [Candidatus Cerribacteria bacterium 'Amazon FNV 2010 28 9']|uniref:Uncharacterized protein n=1 Tax=Candidatus Cerribacteria bacterium 'Amazon FNV 2010 28 9' TaxID=2081795 RepID=A0A317JSI5_9BACT|nr:MAG: hypothetical protein C5B42_05185 [Candidatus Cerribacteria bacterium 'Amazon FNV 2010 28 9']
MIDPITYIYLTENLLHPMESSLSRERKAQIKKIMFLHFKEITKPSHSLLQRLIAPIGLVGFSLATLLVFFVYRQYQSQSDLRSIQSELNTLVIQDEQFM